GRGAAMTRESVAFRRLQRWTFWTAMVLIGIAVLFAVYLALRLTTDRAERFDDPVAQFKYGSTGGDKNFGIPYVIWQVLPVLFRQYLPEGRQDQGWAAFGFIYEDPDDLPDGLRRPRPVGTSMRNYMGIERT